MNAHRDSAQTPEQKKKTIERHDSKSTELAQIVPFQ